MVAEVAVEFTSLAVSLAVAVVGASWAWVVDLGALVSSTASLSGAAVVAAVFSAFKSVAAGVALVVVVTVSWVGAGFSVTFSAATEFAGASGACIWATGVPQLGQNWSPGSIAVPHLVQNFISFTPTLIILYTLLNQNYSSR